MYPSALPIPALARTFLQDCIHAGKLRHSQPYLREKKSPPKFVAAIVILLSVNERNAICRQRQEINRPSRAHAATGIRIRTRHSLLYRLGA